MTLGRRLSMRRPPRRMAPDGDRERAGDRPQRRGLADAVRAEEGDDRAGRHREGEAVQHLDAAVAGADVDELEGLAHALSSTGTPR